MYQAARIASATGFVKVYAHSVSDYALRSSAFKRITAPHPLKVVNIGMTVDSCPFRPEDLAPLETATVRPVWRVVLAGREIKPTPRSDPMSWVTARKLSIEPGHCVRLTTSLT